MRNWLEGLLDRLHMSGSLSKRMNFFFIVILILMMLPTMVSLVILQSFGNQYHGVISREGKVLHLRPLISTDVPDALFMVVAGKVTVQESRAEALLAEFERQLAELKRGNGQQTELLVVDRTLETLKIYMAELMQMAQREAPVAQQETLLDEIRSLAALMGNMLDTYMGFEIEMAIGSSTNLQNNLRLLILGEAGFLLLAILFSVLAQKSLSNAIRKPIAGLESLAARLASGDLTARIRSAHIKELVPLSDSLNTMADKLELLIAENKREQENLKRSELRTLQAQIAPHFLYNTLDTIVWLAQTDRMEEVVKVTKAMSRFFRIALSQGRDWISLEQEVSHIEGYLTIQKVRYREILDYEIDIDPVLYPFQILKLTIQPLVENAIYHGVKSRREGGKVWIVCRMVEGMLVVSVRDNGKGMPPDRLLLVHAMLNDEIPLAGDGSGFGLYNVNKRIKLYYGLPEGLKIESDEQGTCVSFCVPQRSQPL